MNLFSHFDTDGLMWAEKGDRQVIKAVKFEKKFQNIPAVQLSISLMDAASDQYVRYELSAQNVTDDGFDIVFKTWLDTRFARIWINWIAIGERRDPDMWDV